MSQADGARDQSQEKAPIRKRVSIECEQADGNFGLRVVEAAPNELAVAVDDFDQRAGFEVIAFFDHAAEEPRVIAAVARAQLDDRQLRSGFWQGLRLFVASFSHSDILCRSGRFSA